MLCSILRISNFTFHICCASSLLINVNPSLSLYEFAAYFRTRNITYFASAKILDTGAANTITVKNENLINQRL